MAQEVRRLYPAEQRSVSCGVHCRWGRERPQTPTSLRSLHLRWGRERPQTPTSLRSVNVDRGEADT
jgi:hypothetical protein